MNLDHETHMRIPVVQDPAVAVAVEDSDSIAWHNRNMWRLDEMVGSMNTSGP